MRCVNKPETEADGLWKSEADAEVHRHTIVRQAIGAHSGHFIGDTEVHIVEETAAETNADHALRGAAGVATTEVDHIVAIATQTWEVRTVIQVGEEVCRDERDEIAAGVVVQHQAVMSDGILLILGHWNTHAQIAGDMEIPVAFLEGDEGIELATPTTLEDITLTGRDVECQAWSEDEVIGFIIDHCVLETESEIHPALGIVECCVVDFKIAILVGNERKSVGQSVADLQRIKLSTATTSSEAVVNGVMNEDRAEFGADHGIFQLIASTGVVGFLAARAGVPAWALLMRDTAAQALRLKLRNHRLWE